MMLPCSMVDIVFLLNEAVGQFRIKLDDGVFLCSLEGPGRHLNRDGQVLISVFYIAGLCLIQAVLPAQAFFRYYAVTRGHALTISETAGLFGLSILGILPTTFLSYKTFGFSWQVRPDFNYALLWYEGETPGILLVADIRSVHPKLHFFYAAFLMTTAYTITIYYGSKTFKTLDKESRNVSQRTKQLQSQLPRYLVLQARHFFYISFQANQQEFYRNCKFQGLIPLTTAVAPTLCLVISQFCGLSIEGLAALCVSMYSWIPFLNATITIVVIVPYRRALIRIFRRKDVDPKIETGTGTV
ncbi:unnamed protein product [Bursaphelenchus xylophilus]|uniref:(pine wood nematode) hypothetical protein n=1 Tax=Bursaphelenchus xylophilus TaxID=6326 RepID=A0A1I7RJQ5_BURXY|nr:unnamed protein product [Bursaphelenchus xylophilus]CAG9128990.1 unnamed protein product [Bursaphelenchus xylophilus]